MSLHSLTVLSGIPYFLVPAGEFEQRMPIRTIMSSLHSFCSGFIVEGAGYSPKIALSLHHTRIPTNAPLL